MDKRMRSVGLAVVLAASTAYLSGCALGRRDLAREAEVRLVVLHSDQVEIFWTSAYLHGTHVDVAGHVRGAPLAAFPAHGHVDVCALSPDGEVVAEAHTSDIYVPPYRRRRSASGRRFHAHLPIALPAGSVVRLAFHSGEHAHGGGAAAQ